MTTTSWEPDALAAAAHVSPERLDMYAEAGLLMREEGAGYAPDSLYRLRLIRYARQRDISDEDLALATKEQGDLLGIFEDLTPPEARIHDLDEAAAQAGVPARSTS